MATYVVGGFKELEKLFKEHQKSRNRRIHKAVVRAARHGRWYVIQFTLPIAFRTLEKSLQVVARKGSVKLVADAPHAAAVEVGSRPHWPPLEPLIRWVKLRGMQALKDNPKRRPRGTTSVEHATAIGGVLKAMAVPEAGGEFTQLVGDIDAPEQIARAIQRAIGIGGTKPQWYMRSAVPEVKKHLDIEIRIALEDQETPAEQA